MNAEEVITAFNNLLPGMKNYAKISHGQLTLDLPLDRLISLGTYLRDHPDLCFQQLIDLCGVDYSHYGRSEWETTEATGEGFSRGVEVVAHSTDSGIPSRFAVVYHLLSLKHNSRMRLRVFADSDFPVVPSVTKVWKSADWYEREAFDLYGIMFEGHPDLRRILTDYGFVGHPFRKDFPLIGTVEMRYDEQEKRCVYEPVSIEPRTLVPRVIRHDERYSLRQGEA